MVRRVDDRKVEDGRVEQEQAVGSPLTFVEERSGAERFFGALRAHVVLITLFVVVTVGTAAFVLFTAEERFSAQADVLVTPVSASDERYLGTHVLREGSSLSSAALTASRFIRSPDVADAAAKLVGHGWGRDDVLAAIDIHPLSQSDIFVVEATASQPAVAAAVANAVPERSSSCAKLNSRLMWLT